MYLSRSWKKAGQRNLEDSSEKSGERVIGSGKEREIRGGVVPEDKHVQTHPPPQS